MAAAWLADRCGSPRTERLQWCLYTHFGFRLAWHRSLGQPPLCRKRSFAKELAAEHLRIGQSAAAYLSSRTAVDNSPALPTALSRSAKETTVQSAGSCCAHISVMQTALQNQSPLHVLRQGLRQFAVVHPARCRHCLYQVAFTWLAVGSPTQVCKSQAQGVALTACVLASATTSLSLRIHMQMALLCPLQAFRDGMKFIVAP